MIFFFRWRSGEWEENAMISQFQQQKIILYIVTPSNADCPLVRLGHDEKLFV